jgi:NAD(P) transhydrogenase subunit alpha
MSKRVMSRFSLPLLVLILGLATVGYAAATWDFTPSGPATPAESVAAVQAGSAHAQQIDFTAMLFVFMLASFIGLGVIRRVSRLLHTPLMSLTNAISAIAVVGSILVVGPPYPLKIRILGAIALFASMTNIVSGFLITDRMLKMFKTDGGEQAPGGKQ